MYTDADTPINRIGDLLVIPGLMSLMTRGIDFPACNIHGLYNKTTADLKLPITCGNATRTEKGAK